MTDQPISNEVALRIALAARVLPDISVRDLLAALQTKHDNDITEASLGTLTVNKLKRSYSNIYDDDVGEWEGEDADNQDIAAFKEAVRVLWGEQTACEHPLPIEPDQGDMLNSIRIAVASNTGEQLDEIGRASCRERV